MRFRNKPFEDFATGDRETYAKTFSAEDLERFAELSGDDYPLHVDDGYAKSTRFGGRIAHGMLTASLLSTVNARILQLPGGIYVSQTLVFKRPVRPGDTITASSEVVAIDPQKRRLHCKTACVNQDGKVVVEGEAVLQKDPA